jgi:hypothetical protein
LIRFFVFDEFVTAHFSPESTAHLKSDKGAQYHRNLHTWIDSNILGQNKKQISGEIVSLNNNSHKASIKYLDANNKEVISTISFLDLMKSN